MKKNEKQEWQFESHQEIRDYVAKDFPVSVYLDGSRHGWVKADGSVVSPTGDKIGTVEDFLPEEFRTSHNFVAVDINANTMLEGLYQAGEMLAKRLKTAKQKRTSFTAKELTLPVCKGGVELNWPEIDTETMYRVFTPWGRYMVPEKGVWNKIDQAEKVTGVGPAKRRVFTILPAEQEENEVVARMSFDVDAMLPKLKACCEKEENLRPIMFTPAVEVATGVVVASDGHILVAHKLKGYQAEEDERLEFAMVRMPREVMQMKGRVEMVVTLAKWKENKIDYEGISITATDAHGKSGHLYQAGRYPNWRSVTPQENLSLPIPIDAAAMTKAVKLLSPQLSDASHLMCLTAEMGAENMELSGGDIDFSTSSAVKMSIAGGMPTGIWIGLNAEYLKSALAFKPTRMHYIECDRPVLFFSEDTMVLQMPMYREETMPEGKYGVTETMSYRLDDWIGKSLTTDPSPKGEGSRMKAKPTKVIAPKPAAVKVETTKAETVIPETVKPETVKPDTVRPLSISDRLREALRRQLAA